jgi:hypothetical protein
VFLYAETRELYDSFTDYFFHRIFLSIGVDKTHERVYIIIKDNTNKTMDAEYFTGNAQSAAKKIIQNTRKSIKQDNFINDIKEYQRYEDFNRMRCNGPGA